MLGSGNVSDTAHWSATSGGAGGASVPGSADIANFDSLSNASNYTVTFDVNVSWLAVGFAAPLSGAQTLSLGATIVTLGGPGGVWSVVASTIITATSGTIRITDTSATNKVFNGGGKTYGVLDVTTGGTGVIVITGSNTFTRITVTGSTGKLIAFVGGITTTLTGTTPLPSGIAGNTIQIDGGTSPISAANAVSIDYVALTNLPAAGNIPFYSGTHSVNNGGNTNWVFTAPPSAGPAFINEFAALLLLN